MNDFNTSSNYVQTDVLFLPDKIRSRVATQPNSLIDFATNRTRDLFAKIYVFIISLYISNMLTKDFQGQVKLWNFLSTKMQAFGWIRLNKLIQALSSDLDDTDGEDVQSVKCNSYKALRESDELSKEAAHFVCFKEEPDKGNERVDLLADEGPFFGRPSKHGRGIFDIWRKQCNARWRRFF